MPKITIRSAVAQIMLFLILAPQAQASSCSAYRLDTQGQAFAKIPIHDQRHSAACYAYAASELYDEYQFRRTGALLSVTEPVGTATSAYAAGLAGKLMERNSFFFGSIADALSTLDRGGSCPVDALRGIHDPDAVRDYLRDLNFILARFYSQPRKSGKTESDATALAEELLKSVEDTYPLRESRETLALQIQRIGEYEAAAAQFAAVAASETNEDRKRELETKAAGIRGELPKLIENREKLRKQVEYHETMKELFVRVAPSVKELSDTLMKGQPALLAFLGFIRKACKPALLKPQAPVPAPRVHIIRSSPSKLRRAETLRWLGTAADARIPVALELCLSTVGDIFRTRSSAELGLGACQSLHAAVIIGRRPTLSGGCEYLVRDSYGKDCRGEHESICRDGQYWVPESRLLESSSAFFALFD